MHKKVQICINYKIPTLTLNLIVYTKIKEVYIKYFVSELDPTELILLQLQQINFLKNHNQQIQKILNIKYMYYNLKLILNIIKTIK